MTIERILVPLDFSETSLQALDYAVEFAKPLRAEIVVLYVIEPIYYAMPSEAYGPTANVGLMLEEQRRIGTEQLANVETSLRTRGVQARTVMRTGTAYQLIVDEAKHGNADLIIMATHGRTGLSHVLLGSVAEKVVRTAACPVLTVRGTQRAAEETLIAARA